jgi:hypothetical protein
MVLPSSMMVQPRVSGHDFMNIPLYSFLIENEKVGKKLLFDLGMMKAWKQKSPPNGESQFEIYVFTRVISIAVLDKTQGR